uniref:UvrD-like helicase, ATP-binding domain, P-loop containing nucleoside triphosphate hydrolase n=1 Tax=Tanacetum cinerariifolium TaxID=118510 RepID=A0A699H6B5_TANCI|nr:UvrD-like helicase, ATP-binding domain, P-loop containing nucleoside triphosphate hydrolase [Tanacetum cinerariifolium]
MTVSVLPFILLHMYRMTLVCAPVNVAIIQLAPRVLMLVRESYKFTIARGDYFYPVGDVVLFGIKERLNVSTDIKEIFLEHQNTLGVNTSSHNVVVGTILELPSQVNVNLNVNPVTKCKGELQMKQEVLKEISELITRKKGILPCIFFMESAMTEPVARHMVVLEYSSSKTEFEQKGDDAKNKKGKGNEQKKGKRTKAKRNDGTMVACCGGSYRDGDGSLLWWML